VHTGKGEKLKGQPLPADFPPGTHVHADLSAFADWLLAEPQGAHA
jgi:D-glycero-D-manno-heptose 1,7-bisphosphate phosphatase